MIKCKRPLVESISQPVRHITNSVQPLSRRYDDSHRILAEDFIVYLLNENGCILSIITIPNGFIWDGASIPKLAWSLVGSPFNGAHYVAALLHDYIYATEYFPRSICDELFYIKMREDGVCWFKAASMSRSVKLFGGFVWDAHTCETITAYRALTAKHI